MKTVRLIASLLILYAAEASEQPRQAVVVIENAHVRYTISADGKNLAFVDRLTGVDYLRREPESVCALVRQTGKEYPATSVLSSDGRLVLRFGETDAEVSLRVEPRKSYIRTTVESVKGDQLDSIMFLNIPLTVKGRPDESFGSCALSLNLITRVDQLPALQTHLQASCCTKFGIEGAKVAIIAMPTEKMLPALKNALTDAEEMPHCPVAGPWAHDIPFNHGSYLFNFGALTESNADDWIAMARNLGVTQIDHHGGSGFFRFGDFALNPAKWPEEWEGYRGIVRRLHDAGIGSIFHT